MLGHSLITLTTAGAAFDTIKSLANGRAMWENLQAEYGHTDRRGTLGQLSDLSYNAYPSASLYMNRVDELRRPKGWKLGKSTRSKNRNKTPPHERGRNGRTQRGDERNVAPPGGW